MDLRAELIKNENNDLTVVNAARVSFDKQVDCVKPGDVKLIKYLASHDHWTPFSHCRFTFRDTLPILNKIPEDSNVRTGLIFSLGGRKVRHSFFGWVQLIKGGHVSPIHEQDIINKLSDAMPISAQAYGLKTGKVNTSVTQVYKTLDPRFTDFTLRETVPIFVARQRFKHMVDFAYNEVSRRYVSDVPEFHVPEAWRGAPTDGAKQGSSADVIGYLKDYGFMNGRPTSVSIDAVYEGFVDQAKQLYETFLESGVAPEQARMVLPQSMMTSYYVTGNLYAWRRAYGLRIDAHAQKEIRDLAVMWGDLIDGVKS